MNAELLRVLIDIEVISCLAGASSLIIAASIEDIKTRQAQLALPLYSEPAESLSLRGIYMDFSHVLNDQIKSAASLTKPWTSMSFKIIKIYMQLVVFALPFVLLYITYEAVRFHVGFLTAITWASLCTFMLLATLANRELPGWRKLRLMILNPVIYWPFILLSVFWSFAIAKNALKFTGTFFMEAKVLPDLA